MQSKLLLAGLAASASAAILPRQTDSSSTGGVNGISKACQSDLIDLSSKASGVPVPPSNVASLLVTATGDICNYTPPASVSSAWNSYTSEARSWIKDNEDMFKKLVKDCGAGNENINIPDVLDCKSSSSSDDSKGDSKDDSKSDSKSDDKDDKDSAASLNAPVAVGAVLAAGMAAIAAL